MPLVNDGVYPVADKMAQSSQSTSTAFFYSELNMM